MEKLQHLLIGFIFMVVVSCGSGVADEAPLYSDVQTTSLREGDVVRPFSYINPNEKGWKVVIEISGDDLNHLSTRVPGTRLSTTKPQLLRRVKNWKFVLSGGDLATVTSSILVYKDRELVDQQGIVLDNSLVGLQSMKYGWIIPENDDDVYTTIARMERGLF